MEKTTSSLAWNAVRYAFRLWLEHYGGHVPCGTTGLRFPPVELASCGATAAAGAGAGGCNLRYVWWQDEKSEGFVSCPTDTLTLTSSLSSFLQSRIGTLGLLYRGMQTPLCFINNYLSWLYKLSLHCFNLGVFDCQYTITWVTKHTCSRKIPGERWQGLQWLPH